MHPLEAIQFGLENVVPDNVLSQATRYERDTLYYLTVDPTKSSFLFDRRPEQSSD